MKKIIVRILVLVAGFFIFLTGQTVGEHIIIRREVKEFTSKGVLQEDISTDLIKYYKVSRETYYPEEYVRDPFYQGDLNRPGAIGDIFVTQTSPLALHPGVHQFVSFYFGGHAAYVDENNRLFETIGIPGASEKFLDVLLNGGENTHAMDNVRNYWLDPNHRDETDPGYRTYGNYYRKEWIGLRVKESTLEDNQAVVSNLRSLAEQKAQYNFLFVLNTKNRYYCTDLVTRSIEKINDSQGNQKYKFNKDGFAVTINDMILSKDTYIAYFVTTDRKNVKHVYYIG